jgi:DNA-binding MarR family transcriptional regulator
MAEVRPRAQRSAQREHPLRKLTESERRSWVGLLRVHNTLIKQLDAELQAAQGLPLAAFDVLAQLARVPGGERSMSELAEALLLSPSGCTRLVDRLEAQGLVERRRGSRDSRVVMAAITQTGRRRLLRALPVHLRGVRQRFTDRLSEQEIETLGRIWSRVLGDLG